MRTVNRSSLPPEYVTGLVEASGSFTFSRSRGQFSLYFAIRLGHADAEVLRAVQRYFRGHGRIYSVRPASKASKPASYYRVNRLAELRRIVLHFDRYPLRGSKRRSYEIWKRMVMLKVATFGEPPGARLETLARALSGASARGR
ncbi:MAG: LAGLIDADG family homing endonuclease [Synechococcaceae cyanobacterium]|nr:LAGLIDADG family homing endonuclease [Synechococcaceae cyanobacterium]